MQKRETDWTAGDQAAFLAIKQITDLAPPTVKQTVFHSMRAPYGLTASTLARSTRCTTRPWRRCGRS